jgi:hypothetical protein
VTGERHTCLSRIVAAALTAAALLTLSGTTGRAGTIQATTPQPISGLTPLPREGEPGWCGSIENFEDWEFDDTLAVNPVDADNIVAAWVQDFNDGLVAAASSDGGASWEKTVMTPACQAIPPSDPIHPGGGTVSADDPWLSFGPDGILYLSYRLVGPLTSSVVVHTSLSGGKTWSPPLTVETAAFPFELDVTHVVADPHRAGHAYALWGKGQAGAPNPCPPVAFRHYVSHTENGGATWSVPVEVPAGAGMFSVGQLVVLGDGTLLDVIVEVPAAATTCTADGRPQVRGPTTLSARRSTDLGVHWSEPSLIAQETDAQADASGQSAALAPDGTVYVAWQTRLPGTVPLPFSVLYSSSRDGGKTWQPAAPVGEPSVLVGPAERVQSGTLARPALAVAADGTVGVGFYDRRNATDADHRKAVDYWLRHSHDGGRSWREDHVAGPFDLTLTPSGADGPSGAGFTGCCQVLAPLPGGFAASFALGEPLATPAGPESKNTDIFFSRLRIPELTGPVRSNRIRNGSFEQSANGTSPDGWSSAGSTAYESGGSDGMRSVSTQPGASWISDAVPIEAGVAYDASVVTAGAGGTLFVDQLAADGTILASVALLLSPTSIFTPANVPLTAGVGATQARVVLLGGLTGKTSFDEVGLFSG